MSASMTRLETVTASTKRNVSQSGKAPVPTVIISSMTIMPLSILDAQTRARVVVDTPHQLKQTCKQSDTELNLQDGDFLIIAGKEYPIRDVAPSPWMGGFRYQIVVEDLATNVK